jgi:hypothetical protein
MYTSYKNRLFPENAIDFYIEPVSKQQREETALQRRNLARMSRSSRWSC